MTANKASPTAPPAAPTGAVPGAGGCPHCYGLGYVDDGVSALGIPVTRTCACQHILDLTRNLERAWAGLSKAPALKTTPLLGHEAANLYVTATDADLRAHLRHVGLRQTPQWSFKVASDADLMTAWLAPIALAGQEIIDPDAYQVSTTKATLVDLVEPPRLLILRLGVKSARNAAMPEVLLETLRHREHLRAPVWLVDQPLQRLTVDHRCFSDEALDHIRGWKRLTLSNGAAAATAVPAVPPLFVQMLGASEAPEPEPAGEEPAEAAASGFSGGAGGTRRVALPNKPPAPKKRPSLR